MKTKEELLKIYSAYLPYRLKIGVMGEFTDEERTIPQIFEMVGLDTNYLEYHESGRTVTEQIDFSDVFPHLWSMEMLTQEIEHKGERFVPIVELAKLGTREKNCYVTNSNIGTCYVDAEYQKKGFFIYHPNGYFIWQVGKNTEPLTVWNQLKLFNKLFEWHFNVFSLSENEYIKKETRT